MVKEFENTGYWAVILGGSSGLGLASALKLAQHGMNICVIHRDGKAALGQIEQEFASIRATGVQFKSFNSDATQPEKQQQLLFEIKQLMGNGGRIRCVLHSIAKGNLKPMTGSNHLTHDDFDMTIASMSISLYDWTQLLYQAQLFSADARVLAFTSEGSTKAWTNYAAVAAAKAALEAISRNIALEFATSGLRCNCIQAGVTDTKSFRMIPGNQQLSEHTLQRNPFKRLTTAEDVANVVYLLCKDEAAWINGAVIPVNGGEHIS